MLGQLAPSAYLASGAASSELIQFTLPHPANSSPFTVFPNLDAFLLRGSHSHDHPPQSDKAASIRKMWVTYKVERTAVLLLENAAEDMAHARLLALSTKCLGHGYTLSKSPLWA